MDSPLATAAWRRARQLRRQALAGAGAAALAILLLVALGPHSGGGRTAPSPDGEVPAGVTVLPPFAGMAQLPQTSSDLPARLNGETVGGPPGRTLALARAAADAPLLAIAADGQTHVLDDAQLGGARLVPTSLSPTGDRAVLLRDGALQTIDLASGESRVVPADAARDVLVWRGAHTVLIATVDGAQEVDLDSGATTPLAGVSGVDVASPEGVQDPPLTELLAVSSTGGQRSQIRLWRSSPSAAGAADNADVRPTFGPQWIGIWSGPGWSSAMLLVRACTTQGITLPRRFGTVRAAIGAVATNGVHAGTLVATDDVTLAPLGFLSPQTVLVSVTASGGTRLLGWAPSTGTVSRVSASDTPLTISVADLVPPS